MKRPLDGETDDTEIKRIRTAPLVEQIAFLRDKYGLFLKDDHTILPDPNNDPICSFNAAGNWCKFWNGAGCRHQHKHAQGKGRRGTRGGNKNNNNNNNNSQPSKNITVNF